MTHGTNHSIEDVRWSLEPFEPPILHESSLQHCQGIPWQEEGRRKQERIGNQCEDECKKKGKEEKKSKKKEEKTMKGKRFQPTDEPLGEIDTMHRQSDRRWHSNSCKGSLDGFLDSETFFTKSKQHKKVKRKRINIIFFCCLCSIVKRKISSISSSKRLNRWTDLELRPKVLQLSGDDRRSRRDWSYRHRLREGKGKRQRSRTTEKREEEWRRQERKEKSITAFENREMEKKIKKRRAKRKGTAKQWRKSKRIIRRET